MAVTKVVVVGGGFGGLTVARKLAGDKNFHVTLIDRKNHHLFQPLLYQVAMTGLNPSEIAVPFRKVLGRYPNVDILLAEVQSINFKEKTVTFEERSLDYDYLVVAVGTKHHYFGNEQWEKFAPGLKNIEQATEIRRRILLAMELAEKACDEKERQALLNFVVVGGGPTGVEMAGAIAELTKRVLFKEYKKVDLKQARIFLVEAGERILSAFPENLSQKAERYLSQLGVEVLCNKPVKLVDDKGVHFTNDQIESSTVVWAAGVKPSSLSEKFPLENRTLRNQVKVNGFLQPEAMSEVFVLGDMAHCLDSKGEALPGLAPVAIQQGENVAENLKALRKGKKMKRFSYFDKGMMATVGRSRAVLKSGKIEMGGTIAWLAWAVVHLAFIIRFRNRVFVLLQWLWSYARFGYGARLIIHKSWRFYDGKRVAIDKETRLEP